MATAVRPTMSDRPDVLRVRPGDPEHEALLHHLTADPLAQPTIEERS